VKDLFVTNGSIFSSRKENFIKSQTIFARRGITAMAYSDKWRQHRRLATTYLAPRGVEALEHVIDLEATELVRELYVHGKAGTVPVNPQPLAGRSSLNNMLTIVFGMRTDTINHPLVAQSLKISREFMNCTGPVSNLTDFIPWLQQVPNSFTARAKNLHKMLLDTYGGMMDDIFAQINRGEDVPDSLVKMMHENKEKENLDWLDMVILCSAFMIGGVETTASLIQWFSALIPAYPEIQAKAHAELDAVIGHDRLPTLEDRKDLPYINAIIKELERSRNPFWLGTPHQSMKDFTYRGQFIPKDTVLIMNSYTMHHNPERYPDPFSFNPERYIDDSLTSVESINLSDPMARDHFAFGAGRRVCPGTRYAEHEIYLAVSRILWAYKLEEIPGEPIDLNEYDGLSGRSPVPFRINLIPRHDKVGEVLGC
jgi:cytochrome P450